MVNGFTSGLDPMRVAPNHDPEPWMARRSPLRRATIRMGERHEWELRPRPEFDVLDNPILAELRRKLASDPIPLAEAAEWFQEWIRFGLAKDIPSTPEQTDHAWRVLSKLAALA